MVASLILLPFYTNYLNQLQFLQVSFYITISLLFQIFFAFSADTYFGIKYTGLYEQPQKQKEFIGTTSLFLLINGFIWLLITTLSGEFVMKMVFKEEYQMGFWPYGFYSVLTAFFNAYFKTATNSLIYFKKPLLFFVLNSINFTTTLLISIGGLFLFPDSIIGPMYGRLLSGVLIFFLGFFVFVSNGKMLIKTEFFPEMFRFCFPYVIYVTSLWVLSFVDRFMLQRYISEVDLNTYDLVLKCFFGIEFIQNSLTAVIFPKVYEIWSKTQKLATTPESNRYFNVFTVLNTTLLILFCLFIPVLYNLLITQKSFHEAASYIGLLAAGFGLRSILYFYTSTILYSKNIKILLKIFFICAVFHIVLTYYAASYFGLLGVIFTGLIIKLFQLVLSWLFTRTVFVYNYNIIKIWIMPLLYLLINIIQFFIFPTYNALLYLIQLTLFSVTFFYMYKKEIFVVAAQFGLINRIGRE